MKTSEEKLRIYYPKVKVFETLPDGWKINKLATTAPCGYQWCNNQKPIFGSGGYENALVKIHADEFKKPKNA